MTSLSLSLGLGVTSTPRTGGGGLVPRNNRILFDGDSLTDQGQTTLAEGVNAASFDNIGYSHWVRAFLGGVIESDLVDNNAVSGSFTSSDPGDEAHNLLYRLQNTDLTQYGVGIILIGANNSVRTPAFPDALSDEDLMAIYQLFRSAGTPLMPICVLPRPPGGYGGDAQATIDRRNRALHISSTIRQMAATLPGIILADATSVMTNPGDPNGDGYPADFYDTVHTKPIGAMKVGRVVADLLRPLFPAKDILFSDAADVWSVGRPTGNQLVNGLLTGSSGAIAGVATGNAPTSWSGNNSGAGSKTSGTANWTKETGVVGDLAVLTLDDFVGTYTGFNCFIEQAINQSSGKFQAGDVIEVCAEVHVAAGHRGLWSAGIRIIDSDGVTTLNWRDAKGYDQKRPLGTEAFTITLRSPKFTIRPYAGSGTQRLTVRLDTTWDSTVASGADGIVKFGRVSVRKVG